MTPFFVIHKWTIDSVDLSLRASGEFPLAGDGQIEEGRGIESGNGPLDVDSRVYIRSNCVITDLKRHGSHKGVKLGEDSPVSLLERSAVAIEC